MKEETTDYLEQNTIKDLVQKYSQFINFNIYLWDSKTVQEEEPIEEEAPADKEEKDADAEAEAEEEEEDEDDASVSPSHFWTRKTNSWHCKSRQSVINLFSFLFFPKLGQKT